MKSKPAAGEDGVKQIAANRKAFHEYHILDKLEVGIALVGSELRPCREGKVNLVDAFAEVVNGELWLVDAHIGSNPFSNRLDHTPLRRRRLLAHKNQIRKFGQKAETGGMTIVPLRVYFRAGRVKVEIALAKGKAQYDKRETIAKKDLKREMDREMSGRR
ncbi:MAG: SsrA-binding protein SmpB [Candidatus Riflebacteria bacterium]|nr:SsrA-binding protein SmpB [Candidatus Riflebacteria bacterium]